LLSEPEDYGINLVVSLFRTNMRKRPNPIANQ